MKRCTYIVVSLTYFLLFCINKAVAQRASKAEEIIAEFSKINGTFKSLRYGAFSMHIELNTDTVNGVSLHEEQDASYVVSNSSYYYKMGGMEYLQNDSVLITVSSESKVLMLQRSTGKAASDFFPSGDEMTKVLTYYTSNYNYKIQDIDSTRIITLIATNPNVQYQRMLFALDIYNYDLLQCEYDFYEPIQGMADSLSVQLPQNYADSTPRRHTMSFSITKVPFDLAEGETIFSESKFVNFDGKRFWPIASYRNYEFYDMITGDATEEGDAIPDIIP